MQLALIAPLTSTHAAIDSFFKFLQLNEGVRAEFEKILETKSGKPSSWFSLPRAIPQIKGTVLYAQDTDDIITPIKAVEPIITAQYPNVEFFITEGLGHKRIYRDTRVIQKVVEFF